MTLSVRRLLHYVDDTVLAKITITQQIWLFRLQLYRCVQFNSVLFGVVVHAVINKIQSLMRGSLCGKRTCTLKARSHMTIGMTTGLQTRCDDRSSYRSSCVKDTL